MTLIKALQIRACRIRVSDQADVSDLLQSDTFQSEGRVMPTRRLQDSIESQVVGSLANMEDLVVSDVELDEQQSRISIHHIPDQPGVCADLFEAVAEGDVMVDMIVQNIGRDGTAEVSFTVQRTDIDRCLLLVREVVSQWEGAELTHDREIDKLTVTGIGLRSHTSVGDMLFRALADADVNVRMINTSEVRLSVVVGADEGQKAATCLHRAFGNDDR